MSAGKTLIGGTGYEITAGKTLIGGTGYEIIGGKTLIGGTGYSISFMTQAFNPDDLIDFEYTDNGDGTATLTGWKGTLNGVTSTIMSIPDDPSIIL